MVSAVQNILRDFDLLVVRTIEKFLVPYSLEASDGMFTKYIPHTIHVGFYILLAIIPFAIMKLFYPFKKWVHYTLIYLIFFLVLDVAFIFFEFFEILFA